MHNSEQWTYYGDAKQHLIQMVHHLVTDEVAIKLNGSLLVLEKLPPKENKKFSFFIDGELCEVHIQRRSNGFVYQFLNQPYSTSKIGKERKFRSVLQEWGVAIGMILIVSFIAIPLTYGAYKHFSQQYDLGLGGIISTATITHLTKVPTSAIKENEVRSEQAALFNAKAYYKFLVNRKWYSGTVPVFANDVGKFISPNGLPLSKGSEFDILFSGQNPRTNEIQFHQPSEKQLNNYHQLARNACLQNPNPSVDSLYQAFYCDCFNTYIHFYYPLKGLMQIAHQNESKQNNQYYNQESYQQFMQNNLSDKVIKLCKKEMERLKTEQNGQNLN